MPDLTGFDRRALASQTAKFLGLKKDTRLLFPRAGAWLFRHRTAIPWPLALLLLFLPADSSAAAWHTTLGVIVVAAAETLRLWAVRHIGVISRTRSDRLGPLISTGPFAFVRNPLYLANIGLWFGFAITARLVWLAPILVAVLWLEYHAIVRWEEDLLTAKRGDEYRGYADRVPRWVPFSRQSTVIGHQSTLDSQPPIFSWRDTLYSERGTLIAIAVGFALLWVKSWF